MRRAFGPALLGIALIAAAAVPAAAATRPSPRDQAILAAGVVQPGDVPAGWTAQKQPGSSTVQRFKGVSACKQLAAVTNAALITVPHRLSQQFADPSGVQTMMASVAYAFKDVATASRYVAGFKPSTTPTCYAKAVQHSVQSSLQGAPATVGVSPLTTLAGIGDDSVGHSVTLTVTTQGPPQTLYDDVVIVRSGRAVVTFNVQNADAELSTLPAIVRQVVNRVAPLAT